MNRVVFRTLTEVSQADLSGIVRLIRVAIKKHRSGERGEGWRRGDAGGWDAT